MLKLLLIVALASSTVLTEGAILLGGAVVDKCPANLDTKNWEAVRACLAQKVGTTGTTPGNTPLAATAGSKDCTLGYHYKDGMCHPNTAYCSTDSYDKDTHNCWSCKWYAFQVQGDLTNFPHYTGDYCQTNWWWFVLALFLATTTLLLFLALLRYFCCRPKPKVTKEQRLHPVEVEGEHERPHREERGEVKEWRDEPVVREHRGEVHHGQRVHVETRTYSPNREVQRVSHEHQDWARWSQANWQGH